MNTPSTSSRQTSNIVRRLVRRAAFTLIEIMVVIVIIMILVGFVIGAAKYIGTKSAKSRAQAEIAAMETSLESFKNDNGVYPPSTANRETGTGFSGTIEINNSIALYNALSGQLPQISKIYMTFKPEQTRVDSSTRSRYLVDPFGSPYNYYRAGQGRDTATNSTSYDLWSYGPDGQNDTPDDITNWRQ